MRLRLTHRLVLGQRLADALAVAIDPPGGRWFVPGWLACGECGPCRRGWLGACPRGRALIEPGAEPPAEVDLGERFLTAVDDPPGVAALDDTRATCAGLVAELQELMARAGLGSGDVAIWIGGGACVALGARLSTGRGCATFRVEGPSVEAARAGIQEHERQAPNGFVERRLFVARAEAPLVEAALALAVPGASVTFLDGTGSATLPLAALASCRVLVAPGRGFHPDLVPEALAALRRDPSLTDELLAGSEARILPR